MRNRHIRIVVLLGAMAILSIVGVQVYFITREWSNKQKQFAQTVTICLRNVASSIYSLNQTMTTTANPVRQLSSNYFVVDLNSEIDANVLEHYLKSEFLRYNIQTDFEYGIYDCETDQMEYGNYIFYNGAIKENALSVNLPKYSGYNYYFGINFPLLQNTIAGDMKIWFFLIGVLLLSVLFFAYAIFVILQQKRLSELQRDFINNMTHEFKTPIASINIAADVISKPASFDDPSRILTYGSVIKQEVNRLNDQVDKVLQIARIEKSALHLKMEQLNINSIIELVISNFLKNNPNKIQIITELDKNISLIEADQLHLTNIFHNLLDNAAKYAGNQAQVFISTENTPSQKHLLIRFSDNGKGIPKIHYKKIFEKFYRIPTENIHDVKGFGLGLFYVKSICEAHHWKIGLDLKCQQGCCFIIEIPLK